MSGEELRALAEAARASSEGGWLHANSLRAALSRAGEVLERAEAKHIETFNPTAVLALLDERDALRAQVERVRALADDMLASEDRSWISTCGDRIRDALDPQ